MRSEIHRSNFSEIDHKTPVIELIEKPPLSADNEVGYTQNEIGLIRRMYSEIKDIDSNELQELLTINDTLLSVYDLNIIHEIWPKVGLREINERLSDEAWLKDFIDSRAATGISDYEYWIAFSILPLPENTKRYALSQKQNIESGELKLTDLHIEAKTDADLYKYSPYKTRLPQTHLPKLQTYLNTHAGDVLEIPSAEIVLTDPTTKEIKSLISLTEKETAAAMQYVISNLEKETLSKEQFIEKMLHKRVKELLAEKMVETPEFNRDALLSSENIELRFTQNKRGMPAVLRNIINDKDLMVGLLYEQQATQVIKPASAETNASDPGEVKKSETIPLGPVTDFISQDNLITWMEQSEFENSKSKKGSKRKHEKKHEVFNKDKFNELQKAHIKIVHATKNHQWAEVVRIYIEHLDEWPQFVEHRIGAKDVYDRWDSGQIEKYPDSILSIASGPHEELRAQYDITNKLGLPMPDVFSVDMSREMLLASRATLPEGLQNTGFDIQGDMKGVPVENGAFDMVECSSFDNLVKDEDIRQLLVASTQAVKVGGVLRFMVADPFSEELCSVLEQHGVTILQSNSKPTITPEGKVLMDAKEGKNFRERVEYKFHRHWYFLARVDTAINADALTEDLEKVRPFLKQFDERMFEKGKARNTSSQQLNMDYDSVRYNLALSIALQPNYFVEKKGLSFEDIKVAIEIALSQADFGTTSQIFAAIFGNPKFENLCQTVLQACFKFPRANEILNVNLLQHSNEIVRNNFKQYLEDNLPKFWNAILKSNLPLDEKLVYLQNIKLGKHHIQQIEKYLLNTEVSNEEIIALLKLLPINTQINLPEKYKDIPELQELYNQHAKILGTEIVVEQGELQEKNTLYRGLLDKYIHSHKSFDKLKKDFVEDFDSLVKRVANAEKKPEIVVWLETGAKIKEFFPFSNSSLIQRRSSYFHECLNLVKQRISSDELIDNLLQIEPKDIPKVKQLLSNPGIAVYSKFISNIFSKLYEKFSSSLSEDSVLEQVNIYLENDDLDITKDPFASATIGFVKENIDNIKNVDLKNKVFEVLWKTKQNPNEQNDAWDEYKKGKIFELFITNDEDYLNEYDFEYIIKPELLAERNANEIAMVATTTARLIKSRSYNRSHYNANYMRDAINAHLMQNKEILNDSKVVDALFDNFGPFAKALFDYYENSLDGIADQDRLDKLLEYGYKKGKVPNPPTPVWIGFLERNLYFVKYAVETNPVLTQSKFIETLQPGELQKHLIEQAFEHKLEPKILTTVWADYLKLEVTNKFSKYIYYRNRNDLSDYLIRHPELFTDQFVATIEDQKVRDQFMLIGILHDNIPNPLTKPWKDCVIRHVDEFPKFRTAYAEVFAAMDPDQKLSFNNARSDVRAKAITNSFAILNKYYIGEDDLKDLDKQLMIISAVNKERYFKDKEDMRNVATFLGELKETLIEMCVDNLRTSKTALAMLNKYKLNIARPHTIINEYRKKQLSGYTVNFKNGSNMDRVFVPINLSVLKGQSNNFNAYNDTLRLRLIESNAGDGVVGQLFFVEKK